MANIDDSLLLEHLKSIQERLRHLDTGQSSILSEIRSLKGHMASFMSSEVAQDTTIADLAMRIDRIERRLELSDQP
jgi:chromosome segregation ATPase